MQKKIIALAIAGLASSVAFAQSNVTVYGVADVGFSHRGDNIAAGVGSRSSIDSGQRNGSRLGFKGTEALGNGLSAVFVLETGIAMDNGGFTQGGLAFGRQTYAGLTSANMGTVLAGRQYSPQFNLLVNTDPFGLGTVGQNNNVNVNLVPRLNNLIAYVSPSFGGFNVTAGYTNSAAQNESLDNKGTDNRVWAISPVYNNGPIMVGLNYHEIKGQVSGLKVKQFDLAGTYDLKMVKLAGAYGKTNMDAANSSWTASDSKYYMLGATVPVGAAGAVVGSYNYRKADLNSMKASQWAIGYEHSLSKRTLAYVYYSDISNKNGANSETGDAVNGGLGYQNGLQLGMKHSF